MDKVWVEIAKNFEMRTSGGGGSTVISDTPGRGGRGVKKGQIFADVLYGWPLIEICDPSPKIPYSIRGKGRYNVRNILSRVLSY